MTFFAELKRRNVMRVGLAYAAVAWLVAQIADLALGAFGAPDWVMRAFLITLLVGFPIALIIAWVYELTPEGVRVDTDGISDTAPGVERRLDRIIIGVLAAAISFLLVDKFYIDPSASIDYGESQSIAVLPFVNMSDDSDHFADGLSEELMNLLAKNPDLDVAGRTSSFAFKGKTGGFAEIGKALNVEHVLEGSVRRSGDTLRVTAQLIRAANGFHLWSETYDRMMTDIFEIQDDVAGAISTQLSLRLVPESKRVTDDVEAYALYLESMAMTNFDDSAEAIESLKRAVALDPGFAKAYEKLALAYWLGAGSIMTSDVAVEFVRESAERALDIDPSLVVAEVMFASTANRNLTSADYLDKLENAVASEPKNGRVLDMLADALLWSGYYRESLSINDRYVALEPLSSIPYFNRGRILSALGRREESRAAYGRAVDLGDPGAYGFISADYFVAGEIEQAIEFESKFRENLGQDPSVVRYEVEQILDPVSGKEFLDSWLDERIRSHPYPAFAKLEYLWYLMFGYVDELWKKIDEIEASSDSVWSPAGDLIGTAVTWPLSGFRRHPNYITQEKIDLWDKRGAPDSCSKTAGQWTCE